MVEQAQASRDTSGTTTDDTQPVAAALHAFLAVVGSDRYLKPMWGPRRPRTQLPDGLRLSVLRRDRFACCECRIAWSPNRDIAMQVDHVVPHAAGGTDRTDNLRTLCEPCNQAKSNLYTIDVACYRPRLIVSYCYPCEAVEDVEDGVTQRVFCATCKRSETLRPDHAEERELAKVLGRV